VSGKRSRDKGARGERELASLIGAEKISRGGYTGPDLLWRGRYIEVKREAGPISKRVVKLLADAQLVMDRGDGGEWIAHLRTSELMDLLDEAFLAGRREELMTDG
jgi:hypothetical protein